ncbi:hypothetical protein EMCRGX_G020000 [Ephydatia muelleri]
MSNGDTLRVLELRPKTNYDAKLFKLKTGWTLRFKLVPLLYAKNVRVFTEYPLPGEPYKRGQLRELPWSCRTRQAVWDPDRFIDIQLDAAGPFRFVYTVGAEKDGPLEGSGYFVVDPQLGYSPDGITCVTYITKLLGPLAEWKARLQVAKESGYNMVHFTPLQQLGTSYSAYSISNQLRLDSAYLPGNYVHSDNTVTYTTRSGEQKQLSIESGLLEAWKIIKEMKSEWKMLSVVDMVWNHTSFDTPWLLQHPDAGYNLVNSPHLRPAYVLDVALVQFSREVAEGKWVQQGLQPEIRSEGDIENIKARLRDHVFPRLRLWEFFTVDIELITGNFRTQVYHLNGGTRPHREGRLKVIQDPQYRRLRSSVDPNQVLELYNVEWPGAVCFEERIQHCCDVLTSELNRLNQEAMDRLQGQLYKALEAIAGTIRFRFLASNGPHIAKVTEKEGLVPRYFCVLGSGQDLHWQDVESQKGEYVLAHNGWVMNADPLANFAVEGSHVYLERALIVWDDSIKLRYGDGPKDSPFLWDHMTRYTQQMAWMFDGFRLDNCHNTPINVAEGLLDAAREVKPQLYLIAELFTSGEDKDSYFVNKLGINSLIREAMVAGIPYDLGRLPSVTHAMFMDATHDNEPGNIQTRCVYDALPTTAIVSIACCGVGSCRGYDELVPHTIHVVGERRCYGRWHVATPPNGTNHNSVVHKTTGIIEAKSVLNALHYDLAVQGFNQVYVDQVSDNIVAVTRHSPSTHQSVILMAHTAFKSPPSHIIPTEERPCTGYSHVPPLSVQGVVQEIILEARLMDKVSKPDFIKDPSYISGLTAHMLDMRTRISVESSKMCHMGHSRGKNSEVVFTDFCPGSVIVFRVELFPEACAAVQFIRSFLKKDTNTCDGSNLRDKLEDICSKLSLLDLNYVLYRCDSEERDEGKGGGVYNVPGAGDMVYCGIQGVVSMVTGIRDNNDLGHPLCDNLRSGDWLPSYIVNRLGTRQSTRPLAEALEAVFTRLRALPRYLIPAYFEAIVTAVHTSLITSALKQMGRFVSEGTSLVQRLALGSVQMFGMSRSAILPSPLPGVTIAGSLAAGLPHFSTGFMRCWGRDTFVALRGLLLSTSRYEDARNSILSFAACLRHGLLPNLLSGGSSPRYNCRDTCWWWLQSVQDFCKMAPNGCDILHCEVRKLFANDDTQADFDRTDTVTLASVMQDILQKHVAGIKFRERGAGHSIDKDMTAPGFNVSAGVDLHTGFVYGGSVHNCGTWMDKMGESVLAGNKGVPATARDGSAVELVGLCFSTVSWLSKMSKQGVFPYSGVSLASSQASSPTLTYADWSRLIKDNFEAHFWIPNDRSIASEKEGLEAPYIHRTGIYKDSFGATKRYCDFQLRPNFPIAMVVAPELFTPENAWCALTKVKELLLGPLGMKTLDPNDQVYNGYYFNSSDSTNFNTARGFSYHQGPEWVWVIGFFLRARIMFAHYNGVSLDEALAEAHSVLSAHAQALVDSPWCGLPELTNRDGAECPDSCPVQAWSMGCVLEVLCDMQQVK